MKLLLLFVLGFFLVKLIKPFFSKKINKNSKKNIIDAEFEEIE